MVGNLLGIGPTSSGALDVALSIVFRGVPFRYRQRSDYSAAPGLRRSSRESVHVTVGPPSFAATIQLGGSTGVPGAGTWTLPFVMPASLAGVDTYKQVGIIDPGAPLGISGSNGLRIQVGL
jgi:hypothetical protein